MGPPSTRLRAEIRGGSGRAPQAPRAVAAAEKPIATQGLQVSSPQCPPAPLPAPGWQHPKPTSAQLPEGVAPEKVPPRASAAPTRPTQEVPRDSTLLPWRPKGPWALPTLGTFPPGAPAQAPRRLQSLGVSFWFKGCFIQTLHCLQQRCGHKNTQNKTLLYSKGVF